MERRGEGKGGGGEGRGKLRPPFLKFLDPPLWIAALTPNFRRILAKSWKKCDSPNSRRITCQIFAEFGDGLDSPCYRQIHAEFTRNTCQIWKGTKNR